MSEVFDDLDLDLLEVFVGIGVVHVRGADIEFVVRCVVLESEGQNDLRRGVRRALYFVVVIEGELGS